MWTLCRSRALWLSGLQSEHRLIPVFATRDIIETCMGVVDHHSRTVPRDRRLSSNEIWSLWVQSGMMSSALYLERLTEWYGTFWIVVASRSRQVCRVLMNMKYAVSRLACSASSLLHVIDKDVEELCFLLQENMTHKCLDIAGDLCLNGDIQHVPKGWSNE